MTLRLLHINECNLKENRQFGRIFPTNYKMKMGNIFPSYNGIIMLSNSHGGL